MIIKKMKASFGNLSENELELKEGLNIITAGNESGKSTWMAFIRAMFYGIDTNQRDKGGILADKNRYRPWSGKPMSGVMEVEAEGKEIIITRDTASPAAPMRKFSAVYKNTGDEVGNISSESAGLRLLGMEQNVFRRTCFIEQRGIGVNKTPELEKRIENIVTTGDESASYTQAREKLGEWERQINYGRSGQLHKVKAELEEVEGKIARQREMNKISGELRSRVRRLAETKAELEKDIVIGRALEKATGVKKKFDAFTAYNSAAEEIKIFDTELEKYFYVPTETELNESLRALEKAHETEKRLREAKNRKDTLSEELKCKKEAAEETAIYANSDTESIFKRAQKDTREAQRLFERSKSNSGLILGIILAAVGVAAIAGWIAAKIFVLAPLGAAAVAMGLLLAVVSTVKRKRAKREYESILTAVGCKNPEEIIEKAREYENKVREVQKTENDIGSVTDEIENLEGEAASLTELAYAPICRAFGSRPEESEIRDELENLKSLLARKKTLEARLSETENIVAAVGEYAGEEVVDLVTLEKPTMEISRAERELGETRAQMESCKKELNMRYGAVTEIGDPAELAAKRELLKKRKDELEVRLAAIQGAAEVLEGAEHKVRERFSPQLNKRAAEIMEKLTGGRYKSMVVDKEFRVDTVSESDTVARDMAYLSAGTYDQLYLAVRLAMCDLVLKEKNSAPIILDDTLAFFDDERMKTALDVLAEYAKGRQVIVFTCHDREKKYMQNKSNVNTVTL